MKQLPVQASFSIGEFGVFFRMNASIGSAVIVLSFIPTMAQIEIGCKAMLMLEWRLR